MLLSNSLYTAKQVRQLDVWTCDNLGVSERTLMKRAGRAAFDTLLKQWPNVTHLQVFVGSGNNGGDGYVIAALAAQRCFPVTVWVLAEPASEAAIAARDYFLQVSALHASAVTHLFDADQCMKALEEAPGLTVIVDAMLGIGGTSGLRQPYDAAVTCVNQCDLPVLAVDVPTGVNSDTGNVVDIAVRADATVSFVGQKLGNVVGQGRTYSGERRFHSLGAAPDEHIEKNVQPVAHTLVLDSLLADLPERPLHCHKGDCGHVAVVGGEIGLGGAPMMSAQMAARAGAGKVSLFTRPEHVTVMLVRQPEVMSVGVTSGQALQPLLGCSSTVVVGPGLAQTAWSEQLLFQCLASDKPMVVDADALNLLVQQQVPEGDAADRQWVLTPHPGEAGRLLGQSIDDIEADRLRAVKSIQSIYGGAVVLKGAGTVVCTSHRTLHICDAGNPGMASAGMGDILAGLIGALIAQGLSIDSAACLGTALHATAADFAIQDVGVRALLATDLIPYIADLLDSKSE